LIEPLLDEGLWLAPCEKARENPLRQHFKLSPDAVADTRYVLYVAALYRAGTGINRLQKNIGL